MSIDAMGCQTEIAQKIVDKETNYCLAVKGNQPKLHQGIEEFFKTHSEDNFKQVKVRRYETHEQEHGREDSCWYFICPLPEKLPDRARWPNLKAIRIAVTIQPVDAFFSGIGGIEPVREYSASALSIVSRG